jgi:hypothetical protein
VGFYIVLISYLKLNHPDQIHPSPEVLPFDQGKFGFMMDFTINIMRTKMIGFMYRLLNREFIWHRRRGDPFVG